MTNIIMLARDRPRLTDQALESIYNHTDPDEFNLTIMDDGSRKEIRVGSATDWRLWPKGRNPVKPPMVVRFNESIAILGFLRNIGTQVSEKVFGRGDWLCFLDNDVAVFEHWLANMIEIASC